MHAVRTIHPSPRGRGQPAASPTYPSDVLFGVLLVVSRPAEGPGLLYWRRIPSDSKPRSPLPGGAGEALLKCVGSVRRDPKPPAPHDLKARLKPPPQSIRSVAFSLDR